MPKRSTYGSQRRLGRKRRMCGITQHELAHDSGVSLSRIIFAETGRIDLEPEELARVQNVLRQRAKRAMEAVA
jgi:predicted transcriptional regulator